jgi:histidinol-phosphate phosphatase family protein
MHRLPTTVFLDRDGVINRKRPSGSYVETWEQFQFLPGAIEAIRLLSAAQIRVVVVTNQRGVALGRMTIADMDDIHRQMQDELEANMAHCSAVMVCPHEKGTCDCRKPGVGLFRQAQVLMPDIEIGRAVVIGDSASDLRAGNTIGCASFLVGDEAQLCSILLTHPTLRIECWAPSLLDVVVRCLGLVTAAG